MEISEPVTLSGSYDPHAMARHSLAVEVHPRHFRALPGHFGAFLRYSGALLRPACIADDI